MLLSRSAAPFRASCNTTVVKVTSRQRPSLRARIAYTQIAPERLPSSTSGRLAIRLRSVALVAKAVVYGGAVVCAMANVYYHWSDIKDAITTIIYLRSRIETKKASLSPFLARRPDDLICLYTDTAFKYRLSDGILPRHLLVSLDPIEELHAARRMEMNKILQRALAVCTNFCAQDVVHFSVAWKVATTLAQCVSDIRSLRVSTVHTAFIQYEKSLPKAQKVLASSYLELEALAGLGDAETRHLADHAMAQVHGILGQPATPNALEGAKSILDKAIQQLCRHLLVHIASTYTVLGFPLSFALPPVNEPLPLTVRIAIRGMSRTATQALDDHGGPLRASIYGTLRDRDINHRSQVREALRTLIKTDLPRDEMVGVAYTVRQHERLARKGLRIFSELNPQPSKAR